MAYVLQVATPEGGSVKALTGTALIAAAVFGCKAPDFACLAIDRTAVCPSFYRLSLIVTLIRSAAREGCPQSCVHGRS